MKFKYRYHPSKLSTLMVALGAGSRVEFNSEYPNGIAHLMEHMRFKGSNDYGCKELIEKLSDFGGRSNAWTSNDLVAYYVIIPEENIEVAFDYLSQVALHANFPEKELEKEKEVVCQEIKMYEDDIAYLVSNEINSHVFSNSLSFPIVGREDLVRSVSKGDLYKFNLNYYSREHMLVLLSGSSSHDELFAKYFGCADDLWLYKPWDSKIVYGKPTNSKVYKKGQVQNLIALNYSGEDLQNKIRDNRATNTVFNAIFGGGQASRLFMSVREDLGLVYGIGSYMSFNADGVLYSISAATEPKHTDAVIQEIEKQIKMIKEQGVSDQELNRARNEIRSSLYGKLDTSSGSVKDMLSEEFYKFKTGSEFLAEIDKVTDKDILEYANMLFSSNKYLVIGTGMEE